MLLNVAIVIGYFALGVISIILLAILLIFIKIIYKTIIEKMHTIQVVEKDGKEACYAVSVIYYSSAFEFEAIKKGGPPSIYFVETKSYEDAVVVSQKMMNNMANPKNKDNINPIKVVIWKETSIVYDLEKMLHA